MFGHIILIQQKLGMGSLNYQQKKKGKNKFGHHRLILLKL